MYFMVIEAKNDRQPVGTISPTIIYKVHELFDIHIPFLLLLPCYSIFNIKFIII